MATMPPEASMVVKEPWARFAICLKAEPVCAIFPHRTVLTITPLAMAFLAQVL